MFNKSEEKRSVTQLTSGGRVKHTHDDIWSTDFFHLAANFRHVLHYLTYVSWRTILHTKATSPTSSYPAKPLPEHHFIRQSHFPNALLSSKATSSTLSYPAKPLPQRPPTPQSHFPMLSYPAKLPSPRPPTQQSHLLNALLTYTHKCISLCHVVATPLSHNQHLLQHSLTLDTPVSYISSRYLTNGKRCVILNHDASQEVSSCHGGGSCSSLRGQEMPGTKITKSFPFERDKNLWSRCLFHNGVLNKTLPVNTNEPAINTITSTLSPNYIVFFLTRLSYCSLLQSVDFLSKYIINYYTYLAGNHW